MKVTKTKLRQIIKEEFQRAIKESSYKTVNAQLDQLEDIVATGVEKQQDLKAIAAALQGEGFRDASVVDDGALTFTGDDGELYGVGLPGRQDLAGDVTAREIGPYVLGVIGGDEEDDEDPRGNLGGMVDVDYDDPIVGRRGNLEERKITKQKLKQFIQEEKDWMQKAFGKHPGKLHRALGIPEDETISVSKMRDALEASGEKEEMARAAVNANPDKYGSIKDVGVDKKNESLITKESLQEYIKEILAEVTAGAEKFADFDEIVTRFGEDRYNKELAVELESAIDTIISPEMENLGLQDKASSREKQQGITNYSSPSGEPYKSATIDVWDDGNYEVEVYPSTDEEAMQHANPETLMDAINFIRGVLSPQGAVAPAPGEDPAQMELPLQENKNRKIKIRRKKK